MSRVATVFAAILIVASAVKAAPTTLPVQGRVIGADGKAPAGAKAWVVTGDTPDTVTYTPINIDSAGRYRGNASEEAALVIDAPGHGLFVRGLSPQPGKSVEDVRLDAATKLRVTVLDPQGQPAPKITVHLLPFPAVKPLIGPKTPAELRSRLIQTSDENGVCTFEQVRQGMPVSFEIKDDRYAMPDLSETLPIGQQEEAAGALQLRLGGRMTGSVRMADSGRGVPGVVIRATPIPTATSGTRTRPPTLHALTDPEGLFELNQLLPLTYTLAAEPPQAMNGEYAAHGMAIAGVVSGVTLEGQTLSVVRAGTARGNVTRRSDGQPIASAQVIASEEVLLAVPAAGRGITMRVPSARTSTAVDGTFQLHLPPGVFNISSTSSRMQGVEIQEGRAVEVKLVSSPPTLIRPPGPLTVRGRVLDSRGNRIPGVVVRAAATDSEGLSQGKSDDKGEFVIEGVHRNSELYPVSDIWTSVQPVRVEDNQGPFDVVVHEDQFASARVTVLDEAGNPVTGAQIRLVTYHGGTRLSGLWDEPLGPGATWTYRWLPPHRQIEVFAVSPVHSQVIARATLEAGKQAEIVVRLPSGTGRGVPRRGPTGVFGGAPPGGNPEGGRRGAGE